MALRRNRLALGLVLLAGLIAPAQADDEAVFALAALPDEPARTGRGKGRGRR